MFIGLIKQEPMNFVLFNCLKWASCLKLLSNHHWITRTVIFFLYISRLNYPPSSINYIYISTVIIQVLIYK